ncbi:MAG: sulfurtransferase TusA family protein [Candidatus Caenarcaniphilales bacterium]|nr:sulfurtransferase TusA family protein [Candidatus Caenarcaniphilales bacterium]
MQNESAPKLDLRGVKCPMNYVKAKLALEKQDPESSLELLVDFGESVESVIKSLEKDGYKIEKFVELEGFCSLLVRNLGNFNVK